MVSFKDICEDVGNSADALGHLSPCFSMGRGSGTPSVMKQEEDVLYNRQLRPVERSAKVKPRVKPAPIKTKKPVTPELLKEISNLGKTLSELSPREAAWG